MRLYSGVLMLRYQPYVFGWQPRDALLVVREKSLHLLVLRLRVDGVVRLKLAHHGVLLLLDGLVSLVDREVKLGDDRPIHPWLSHIITILPALIPWQEPYDDGNGDEDEDSLRGEIAPIILLRTVEYAHFSTLFAIILVSQCENTKKNYYNRKKSCKFAENFENSYNFKTWQIEK